MYEAFFELTARPFSPTPNPAEYFHAASHEDSLALLKCFLNDGDGMAVLLGMPGVGKTLLGHRLLDTLAPEQQPLFLTTTHTPTISALHQAILHDLVLPYEGLSEAELRLRVIDFLLERFAAGDRTVLVIDEAHHLSADQLEELRMLTNIESRHRKSIQVVLLAQPALHSLLDRPELESLTQRLAVLTWLQPLDSEETLEYLQHAMQRAGSASANVFNATALVEICDRSGGVPRRINQLAHRSMLLAFAEQSGVVDASYVEAAAKQLMMPRYKRPYPIHHKEPTTNRVDPPAHESAMVDEPAVPESHVIEVGAEMPRVVSADPDPATKPRRSKRA